MASFFFEFVLIARETRTVTFSMYGADGSTPQVAAATDQVRFKVWQTNDESPTLDLGDTATANGSSAKITDLGVDGSDPAVATVKFAQGDTENLAAGVYNAELGFIDDSTADPSDAYTTVARGRIRVIGSATGDRGLA